MRNAQFIRFTLALFCLAGPLGLDANTLIDVAFTSAPGTGKTGFAATGVTSNDFWNTYSQGTGTLPNLALVNA
jgi:hypothetical protein